jgi:hypothetical protein
MAPRMRKNGRTDTKAQLGLALPTKGTWGGRREGAGRKPGPKPRVQHRSRPAHAARYPVHVTLRVREHVWNLRSRRSLVVIEAALWAIRAARTDFRVIHFTLEGNHAHMIVEADDASALARGMRASTIRIAKGLNRMMGRAGPVFSDRYHARTLKTPREVRNALAYVLLNHRSHTARRGDRVGSGAPDRFSSATAFDGWRNAPPGESDAKTRTVTSPPRTWLLREGWRRHGLLSLDAIPAAPDRTRGRGRRP